ncbi:unnamed protein product [Pieris brassicae]|uniref:Uncharacterized protein n=1 Tax=Pieris brassicae TaxID=7116 RepID=A0A9P0TL09_PIEBR|nr:unnamed protein product [Pieris brassicae]
MHSFGSYKYIASIRFRPFGLVQHNFQRFAGSQTVPADTPAALNRATIKKSDVNSEISSPKLIHILSERKAELEMCLLSVPVKSKHVFMFAGLL